MNAVVLVTTWDGEHHHPDIESSRQQADCERAAREQGWPVTAVHREHHVPVGTAPDARPVLQTALAELGDDKTLVVAGRHRLGRDAADHIRETGAKCWIVDPSAGVVNDGNGHPHLLGGWLR